MHCTSRGILSMALVSSALLGQVTIESVKETTSKEVVLRYLTPPGYNGPCTVKASYVNDFSGAYAPLADVDPTQFPGSDQDTSRNTKPFVGRSRVVVIGKQIPYWRTLPISATTSLRTSLAVQAATPVFGQLICNGSSQTWSTETRTVPFGLTFAEPTPPDPNAPGFANWPSIDWGNTQTVIDPEYGTEVKRPEAAGTRGVNQSTAVPQEAFGAGWTNPNNILANDAASASITGSTAPLIIPWPYASIPLGSLSQFPGDTAGLDWIQLLLSASGTSGTSTDRDSEVCLSIDGQGGNCYTPYNLLPLPASEGPANYPASPVPVNHWQAPGGRPIPRQWLAQRKGVFQYTQSTRVLSMTGGDTVGEKWATGSRFRVLSANAPAIKNIVGGTPLTIETQSAHSFTTGMTVVVFGANGTLGDAAAGTWVITVVDSTHFQLNGSSGSGSYGRVMPLAGATAGSPPRVYAPNAFLPDSVTVLMGGFVVGDGDWQTLNGNIYVAHQYFGSVPAGGYSENFTLTGATTTSTYAGTYPTGGTMTLLTGRCQQVQDYPIESVIDAKTIKLASPGIGSDVGPLFSGTDLQVSSATNADHVVTSATHPFVQADIGNYVNITGPANTSTGTWGKGIYKILGVSADGWATLDNAPSGGGATLGEWSIERSWLFEPVSIHIRKKTATGTINLQYAQVKIQTSAGNAWPAAGGEICGTVDAVGAGSKLGSVCSVGSASMWIPRDGSAAIQYGKIGYVNAGDLGNAGVAVMGDGNNDRGSIAINPNHPNRVYAGRYSWTPAGSQLGIDQKIIIADYEGDFTTRPAGETQASINAAYPGYGAFLGTPWLPSCYGDGKYNDGVNPRLITGANPRCVTYYEIVPSVQALVSTLDTTHWPKFVSAADRIPCQGGAGARMNFIYRASTNSVWATISCNLYNDEAGPWYAFDLGNEIPIGQPGSTVRLVTQSDTWSQVGGRWSKFHGGMGLQGKYTVQAPHPQTVQSGIFNGVVYNQTCNGCAPHFVDYTGNITTTLGSCAAFAGSPYLPSGPVPDGTGGKGCITVPVSGEPCSIGMSPEQAIILAANVSAHTAKCGTSGRYYLQDAIVGDIVLIDHDADRRFDQLEPAVLIAKSAGSWTLGRGWVYRVGLGNPGFPGVIDHTGDTKRLVMQFSYDTTNGGYPTYFRPYDPLGTVLVQKLGLGHGAIGRTLTAGSSDGASYGVIRGTIEQRVAATAFDFTLPSRGLPWAGKSSGNNVCQDSHMTYVEAASLTNRDPWIVDAAPWNGYNGIAPTLVPGTTSVYKWTDAQLSGTSCTKQYPKFLGTDVRIGMWIARDISGPGVTIDDSMPMTYCKAYVANNCQNGSLPGDVYVVAPLIDQTSSIYQCCGNDFTNIRDLAIGVPNQTFDRFGQVVLRNDQTGTTGRALTSMWVTPRAFDSFGNWSVTSSGLLGVLRHRGTEFVKSELATVTMPPIIFDGVDRSTWWPQNIPIRASAGADNVLVRFGYAHYGDVAADQYYCSTRKENCVMGAGTTATTDPYWYEQSDSYSGISCAAGCTATLPLIPNRVAYYQVVFRSGSTVLRTDSQRVVVSP
jgi:hypothetical protein